MIEFHDAVGSTQQTFEAFEKYDSHGEKKTVNDDEYARGSASSFLQEGQTFWYSIGASSGLSYRHAVPATSSLRT